VKSSGGYRSDDILLLLPSFRVVVGRLIGRMVHLQFEPVLFDGLRTPTEALRNAAKGSGIVDSMHCYGCAADLICGKHGWDCHKNRCGFYGVLGREAEALRLLWGGRFVKQDMPHCQAVEIRDQNTMRALGMGPQNAHLRDALVKAFLTRP
jgi:hypothetical protein